MAAVTRFLVLCLFLIASSAHMISSSTAHSELQNQIKGAEAPLTGRKLGKHDDRGHVAAVSPSAEDNNISAEESGSAAQDQLMETTHHHRHRSIDKSVAGGGVILGGMATVFLVAVFCYIRATGRKAVEPSSPTRSISAINGRKDGVHQSGSPTSSSNEQDCIIKK